MKILVIGDFHGKFPKKLENQIKKEKVDLIISLGDYFPFLYRKLWFKHCYREQIGLWEVIGKIRYKKLVKKDLEVGEQVLKKLNNLSLPIHTIIGNLDYTRINDVTDFKRGKWKWDDQDFFAKIIKKYKNLKRFDYSYFKFKDYIFIGTFGGNFPGHVKSKAYKKYRKKLDYLFKRFRKENKERKVIFVSHNVPYNTKLDLISSKEAHEKVKGKHYGSKLIRRIINKYQPLLAFGGHVHENQGKDKIEKTMIINPGAIVDGKYAIIDVEGEKIKIKFIK